MCHQWKDKGQCSKGDRCSFRHESNDRAKKPNHNAATLSEPSMSRGRSKCVEEEISEAKVTMVPFFHNGSVNSTKQKRAAKPEISVCFRITRLMHNQIKSQRKSYFPKKCGYCEKCITSGFCITRFRCTRFSRWNVSVKPDAESLETNSKGTIHKFYATSCEYRGKERTIVGKNKCHSSPYGMNLRTGPLKRLKDSSDVPEARLGILPKTFTSSKKKTRLHSTFPRRNGYSRLHQQKRRRKEILWWIQELVCTWSTRETSTLLS